MKIRAIVTLVVLSFLFFAGSLFAYNPPAGGEALNDWYSPRLMTGGPSVTESYGPASDAINPALSAIQQRLTLDFSYVVLAGLGVQSDWGSAVNLSASMPSPFAVWGLGTRLLIVPQTLVSLPLGNQFSIRGSIAKDIYPNFWVGAGLSAAFGQRDSLDWGLGLDLGVRHQLGNISFMRDFRWGLVASGLGKWYAPGSTTQAPLGAVGDIEVAYPSPFTLKGGVGFDWFKTPSVRLSQSLDVSAPFFQNILFDTGLTLSIKEAFNLSVGWGLNAQELAKGTTDEKWALPSFGLSATIPITTSKKEDSFLAKQGWSQSEIRPSTAASYLYDDIWAIGGGVTLPLGVVDRKPPKIALTYPQTKHEVFYLSPNADGKNDELVLPINIKDERYVMGYNLKVIDAEGKLVREIQNKESRPEDQGIKSLVKRFAYKKSGIPVLPEIKWDGRGESGQVAPDGAYSFVLTAIDDNGNRGETESFKLMLDSTPPGLQIEKPADPSGLVFSPDGDGNKESLTLKASGSAEDLWSVQVKDSSGMTVRSISSKDAALADISWDGKNDAGQIVPDGVYKVHVSTEDRGGNYVENSVENIIVDTRQPPVSLSIDTAHFSPNADGVRDSISFSPGVPVRTGLSSWSLAVKDKAGLMVWETSGAGAETLKAEYIFLGKDNSGAALKEGLYQAQLSVNYVNGHKPSILSPLFNLDLTKPRAAVKAEVAVFSPNGDGKQDEAVISQSGSEEDLWLGEIRDSLNNLVGSLRFVGKLDPKAEWDGIASSGTRAPDGKYRYRLVATDKAGNVGVSNEIDVQLDTEKKNVLLSADSRAFSPNGDGQRDALNFLPTVNANENVSEWKLSILDPTGNLARSLAAKGRVPDKISWDGKNDGGKIQPDGLYQASIAVKYRSGDEVSAQAAAISIDTVAPTIEVELESLVFSPNGDGLKDILTIKQSKASDDPWEAQIGDVAGKPVRSYSWKAGAENVLWDGTDASGNKLLDGKYRYQVAATDRAGNRTVKTIEGISIDTRETSVFVTASRSGFSPNGDGKLDDISFGFIVKLRDGIKSWKFELADSSGAVRKAWAGDSSASLPTQLAWDGKGDDAKVTESSYIGSFRVEYQKGDAPEAKTGAIILDVSAPVLRTSLSPIPFSPDNDGLDDEVTISLAVSDASDIKDWKFEISEASVDDAKAKGRLFMRYEGQGRPAERVTWDGKSLKGELVEAATDYPYSFSVTDALGNSAVRSGLIPVDVLVIRDGNRLKIKVPSIVFRPNFDDFKELPVETVEKNNVVLKRIAEILNKFRGYRIQVEGHANNVSKIQGLSAARVADEEAKEVLPLSKKRAEAVRSFLIQYGVEEKRLSATGLGSSEPVVDPKDADNRWKNRRVEFILDR